jgi:hypothetical protein
VVNLQLPMLLALGLEGDRLPEKRWQFLEGIESRKAVLNAYGDWFSTLGKWDWFVTLTFRDPNPSAGNWTRPGWSLAKRAWVEFAEFVRPSVGALQWVRCFEIQRERGVPHIHGLVGGLDDTRYSEVSAFLWRKYGFNRILDYDPAKGAAYYINKYVAKELGDIEFAPTIAFKR